MKEKREIELLSQKLTELKLQRKMVEWTFYNAKDLIKDGRKMDAILDEKRRIDRAIEALEKRLEQLN